MSRGLSNCNPGNIRQSGVRYKGEVRPSRDPAVMIPVAAAISRVENGATADPDEIRRGWELFST